jgi:thioredoxin:protein disulfide reductase
VAVKLGYKNVYRDPYGFPEWQAKGYPINSAPAGLSGEAAPPQNPGPLYGWAMIWTLLGIFAGGIALNLTPCVYPMIPLPFPILEGGAGRERENC